MWPLELKILYSDPDSGKGVCKILPLFVRNVDAEENYQSKYDAMKSLISYFPGSIYLSRNGNKDHWHLDC